MEWIEIKPWQRGEERFVTLVLKGCDGQHRYPRRWRERVFPISQPSSEAALLNGLYEWLERELGG